MKKRRCPTQRTRNHTDCSHFDYSGDILKCLFQSRGKAKLKLAPDPNVWPPKNERPVIITEIRHLLRQKALNMNDSSRKFFSSRASYPIDNNLYTRWFPWWIIKKVLLLLYIKTRQIIYERISLLIPNLSGIFTLKIHRLRQVAKKWRETHRWTRCLERWTSCRKITIGGRRATRLIRKGCGSRSGPDTTYRWYC
jgi:hypothetical protein